MELRDHLADYGADPKRVLSLAQPSPDALVFADLLKKDDRPSAVVVDSLVQPVAYVADLRQRPNQDPRVVTRWCRDLALRGESAQLIVVRPGKIDVYDVSLMGATTEAIESVKHNDPMARSFFPRIALQPRQDESVGSEPGIRKLLFSLTTEAVDSLHQKRDRRLQHTLELSDAISLVGRAVFARFLFDRQIAQDVDLPTIHPNLNRITELFSTPEYAAATCVWLDNTFNGDFLPLTFQPTVGEFSLRVGDEGWSALGNILHRAQGGQLPLNFNEGSWENLDFSRIPAGVLSQLYEQQAANWDPIRQKTDSIYYTPAGIADLMVRTVFSELETSDSKYRDSATVLDPSVGGGIFLVSALREIVRQRWIRTKKRPDTAGLRRILETQLFGFDVNESALRLTALSLYLAALELDPKPQPLSSLRFKKLSGVNLLHVGGTSIDGRAGSLGPNVPESHTKRYDVVVGNPPWSVTKANAQLNECIHNVLRPIVAERVGQDEAKLFTLPDSNPDIGFLWRSLQWSKPKGRVALITHARVWLRQSDGGKMARELLLKASEWTSVLNGTALRQSQVWPNMSAPFVIWFGVNKQPTPHASLYCAVAVRDDALNQCGRFRIDPTSSRRLRIDLINERQWLPKTLMRGTSLDATIVARLVQNRETFVAFKDYWDEQVGSQYRGQGYQRAPKETQRDASALLNLPNMTTSGTAQHLRSPTIDPTSLPLFRIPQLARPRKPEIYSAPLLLVRETPSVKVHSPISFVCTSGKLAYSESFFGFSAATHKKGVELVCYLQLLLNGMLFPWFALMSSSKFGVERDSFLLEDLLRFPVPRFENLTALQQSLARQLSAEYHKTPKGFLQTTKYLDWLAELYELSPLDMLTIHDTLLTASPSTIKQAQRPPTQAEEGVFRTALSAHLGELFGLYIPIVIDSNTLSTWRVISIGKIKPSTKISSQVLEEADNTGASLVVLPQKGGAVVAMINQYRYWTPSRARLVSLDLLERDDFVPKGA